VLDHQRRTKDLTAKVHAGSSRRRGEAVGGKGGGRPDMAEAGGKDPQPPEGLADVYTNVEGML
jgi:alanyl-tRNA synthetase